MDLPRLISQPHSKSNADTVVAWMGSDQKKVQQMVDLFCSDEMRVCQKASWYMCHFAKRHPELIIPHLPIMLKKLDNPLHSGVERNTIRIFEELDPPEDLEGEIFERCFNYILNRKKPIAVRAFSMTVASKIALKYPELKEELISVLEEYKLDESAGIRFRVKKNLALLRK